MQTNSDVLSDQQIDPAMKSSFAKVEKVIQVLVQLEQDVLRGFKEKISSPDWSIDLMSEDDLKLAFSLLGIPHLFPPLLKVMDYGAILLLDFPFLEEMNLEMSLAGQLEVLYVVNLIGFKCFDRNKHKENCGVCGIADVEECFIELGISKELFGKIRNRVENLKPYQVIMFGSSLFRGIVGLKGEDKTCESIEHTA
jgi:hypothetical protein